MKCWFRFLRYNWYIYIGYMNIWAFLYKNVKFSIKLKWKFFYFDSNSKAWWDYWVYYEKFYVESEFLIICTVFLCQFLLIKWYICEILSKILLNQFKKKWLMMKVVKHAFFRTKEDNKVTIFSLKSNAY